MSSNSTFLLIFMLFSGIVFTSCSDSDSTAEVHATTKVLATENVHPVALSSVELTLSRGAFHYDSFQLIGNELTYVPSEGDALEGYPEYQENTTVVLSDSTLDALLQEIKTDNIMQLDSVYESMTSCNSALALKINVNGIEKHVSCQDFERGCPEALYKLENKLIQLHGRNLKRVLLPG